MVLKKPDSAAAQLRRRAEKRLAGRPPAAPANANELQRLVHELQVHQIELEMQNEALCEAQAETGKALARYGELYDSAPVGYLSLTPDGRARHINRTAGKILGLEATLMTGRRLSEFVATESLAVLEAALQSAFDHGTHQTIELVLYGSDLGTPSPLVQIEMRLDESRRFLRTSIIDITERRRAEETQRLVASVFSHAQEGILIVEPDGTIVDVNHAYTCITGYSRRETLGPVPRTLGVHIGNTERHEKMWRDLRANGHWYGEQWNLRSNGDAYAELLSIGAVRNDKGDVTSYVVMLSDITAIKEQQRELENIALYDVLTGLPNRTLLAESMHHAMAQAERNNKLIAVVYVDLDGFKAVNDSSGHETGDRLLVAMARRMKRALRDVDTIARTGGDEFVAVLVDLAHGYDAKPVLERLLAAASKPLRVGDLHVQISASLGVALFPRTERVDADQLLRHADQAMYEAKQAGKNRYHFFDAERARDLRDRHATLDRLRQAQVNREFALYYQPKIHLRTGEVVGAEALLRWQHPKRGLLAPSVFLAHVGDGALPLTIGNWVIKNALDQIVSWKRAGLSLPVSVNVDARQLQQTDFADRLHDMIASRPDVVAGDLSLEILETSALADIDHVCAVIRTCRTFGVEFALDDFGTGYASLTYLKRLPVSLIKIDLSFVRDMLKDADDMAILRGILALARTFHLGTIAEGVASPAHREKLLQLGCEIGQGNSIAKPMAASEIPAWTRQWRIDFAAFKNRLRDNPITA